VLVYKKTPSLKFLLDRQNFFGLISHFYWKNTICINLPSVPNQCSYFTL